jgi:hypothetical protein
MIGKSESVHFHRQRSHDPGLRSFTMKAINKHNRGKPQCLPAHHGIC